MMTFPDYPLNPAEHARAEHVEVHQQGCTSTLMAPFSYYDSDGNFHYEDHNSTCCSYECAKGHKWQECH